MILTAESLRWYRNKDTILLDGAFDPLHPGHLAYVHQATVMFPSHLKIVAVASDGDIRAKGRAPLFDQETRCRLVQALKGVDLVVPKTEATEILLGQLKPSYYIKGKDWEGRLPDAQVKACEAYGIPMIYLETKTHSSSDLLRQWALKDAERGLDQLEAFSNQQTEPQPWEPVTDYSFEARKAIEGPHPQLIKDVFQPERVLDAGCGPGHLVRLLRAINVQADGFDLHPPPGDFFRANLCSDVPPSFVEPGNILSYDLVVNRECMEHMTVRQIPVAVRNLFKLSTRYVYLTTRFSSQGLFDVGTEFDVDPTHISLLSQPFLRALCVLNGGTRRRDLEERLDHMKKGRVLVYEVSR